MAPAPAPARRELQGPRPPPLTVNKESWKVKKPVPAAAACAGGGGDRRSNPVVVYVRTPKIIHASPQEFMSLVQSLTGKSGPCSDGRRSSASSSSRANSSSSGVTRAEEEVSGAVQLTGNDEEAGRRGGGDDVDRGSAAAYAWPSTLHAFGSFSELLVLLADHEKAAARI